jgi:hypothetical protein
MQWPSARRRRIAVLCLLALVAGVAGTLAAPAEARQVTQADLDSAAAAVDQAVGALDAAESALAGAAADLDRYTASLTRITTRRSAVADASADTAGTVRDRVARMYMVAGAGAVEFAVEDVAAFTTKMAYLGAIAESDRAAVIDLAVSAADLASLEAEARRRIDVERRRVGAATAEVAARSADLDAARAGPSTLEAEWQRQEAARKAALEAQLRAEEEALRASTSTTISTTTPVTTTTAGSTTTTEADTYGWDPHGGVEQWRPLLTRIFTEWGLDEEKCGPKGCVGPQIENALVIMRCESSGIPFATAGPDSEQGVVGLFQHRRAYWSERVARARSRGFSQIPADATPWNPEHNIIVAALLVWESRETLIGNLSYGRPWSDGPEPWGHWDSSSRYCADPPLVVDS